MRMEEGNRKFTPNDTIKKRVLFICTHNSVRSQMAEGLMNHVYRDCYAAYSAGTKPSKVNPYTVKVMSEIGIDISKNHSKGLDEFTGTEFDYVITVCDRAKEECPFFTGGKKHIHKGFENPNKLNNGRENEPLEVFRQLRDEIRWWIEKTFEGK
ncbi:MAG: arsenate reductase ArsC [Candidatus Altiarchaeota archaeon]|nr:arsenate reductase ArsC [Candidatus Altiarchaeota archaeon]